MKNNKTIFIVLISLLTIVVLYWFFSVFIINRGDYNKVKESMIQAENNFKKLSNERANYTTIKKTREKQIIDFDTLKVHIPLKENANGSNRYIETLDIIQQVAKNNNITISVFKPVLINTFPDIDVVDKQLKQSIKRYLLEMECNGEFISIGKFFEELQDQERLINLLKFKIETEHGIEGSLFCKAFLYTYVFSEYN